MIIFRKVLYNNDSEVEIYQYNTLTNQELKIWRDGVKVNQNWRPYQIPMDCNKESDITIEEVENIMFLEMI